jgi:C4-dicarboxylate-specific signal transduction histidine kinase
MTLSSGVCADAPVAPSRYPSHRRRSDRSRVEVRDSGIGLDAAHLFEAFHATQAGGLAVGLSVGTK